MSREQLAKDNGMTIEFVNWFFDNKKDGCGNAWFIIMAAMWEGWIGREAKCSALAAENAGLKSFGDKLDEMHNDLNGEGTGIQGRAEVACQQVALDAAMEEFEAIKTPATDAFLAEVRAQGVEVAMEHMQSSGSLTFGDCYISLNEFAAQLRKGAAL